MNNTKPQEFRPDGKGNMNLVVEDKAGVRTFDTGATRSAEGDKPDYEGFLSPLALVRFGEYMTKHRKQPDGTLRASDNWQRGIPIAQYLKSLFRHLVSTWGIYRQQLALNLDVLGSDEQEDNLCAILFNAQGMLHELLKGKSPATFDTGAALRQMEHRMNKHRGYVYTGEVRQPKAGEFFLSTRGYAERAIVDFSDTVKSILREATESDLRQTTLDASLFPLFYQEGRKVALVEEEKIAACPF